ncbi:MAG: hypothetical protein ACOCZE_01520, partial [Planctomycetota bacterium]
PSKKYDELVCTAGVTEDHEFVRLYPINFRDLPFSQQYEKYQWIEVQAEKHRGRDSRKESWRPDCHTLKLCGRPIGSDSGTWERRKTLVMPMLSGSVEELREKQRLDKTSLGLIKPKEISDLIYTEDSAEWKPSFLEAMKQYRLWETRTKSRTPPRKVPWKFQFVFCCDDSSCTGHKVLIEDWEVGARYWRRVDEGMSPEQAAGEVREHFLGIVRGSKKDMYFYMGTILAHPSTWVIIGTFYPNKSSQRSLLYSL